MEYIIMAGGRGTRWKDYNSTTKHLIKVNGESLLERIVRQLKEHNIDDISITSNNPLYKTDGIRMNEMIYETKILNMFYYGALNHEVTFLYGDTFYPDKVIKKIINTKTEDIIFFGNDTSIIGIKVVNFKKFKRKLEEIRTFDHGRAGWALFRHINKLETDDFNNCDNFVFIKEKIYNINSPKDYEDLIEDIKRNDANNEEIS